MLSLATGRFVLLSALLQGRTEIQLKTWMQLTYLSTTLACVAGSANVNFYRVLGEVVTSQQFFSLASTTPT